LQSKLSFFENRFETYLAALPANRREALNEVRRGINRALPPGYEEGIQFGMISWFVPLSTYPAGYGVTGQT